MAVMTDKGNDDEPVSAHQDTQLNRQTTQAKHEDAQEDEVDRLNVPLAPWVVSTLTAKVCCIALLFHFPRFSGLFPLLAFG